MPDLRATRKRSRSSQVVSVFVCREHQWNVKMGFFEVLREDASAFRVQIFDNIRVWKQNGVLAARSTVTRSARESPGKMPSETVGKNAQVVGNYDLEVKIADGGMGSVYRARSRVTGEVVAIKILSPHLASNPVLRRRLEQEYNAARTLDHPNVVRALDFGSEDDIPYLVMEFVEGESLGQRIERCGKLEEAEAVRIIAQVAQGLHKAHKQGMIHRDVKPDNVLLTPAGQAKLTDLGLVKEVDADLNLTRTGRGLGTPHFMSPEQFRNAKKADVRCDIYSLGATLYMMVTGQLPFKSCGPVDAWMKKINNDLAPPRDLVPNISNRMDWAIRR